MALGQFLLSATVCDTVPWTVFVPLCLYWATLAPGVFSSECWLVLIVYHSQLASLVLIVYHRRRQVAQCAQCLLAAARLVFQASVWLSACDFSC